MAGPLSLEQIARAVENGPRIAAMAAGMTAMAEDIRALRTAAQNNSTGEVTNNVDNRGGNTSSWYEEVDNHLRLLICAFLIPEAT
jgi:type II secretory pathway component PulM